MTSALVRRYVIRRSDYSTKFTDITIQATQNIIEQLVELWSRKLIVSDYTYLIIYLYIHVIFSAVSRMSSHNSLKRLT
jgi:hypothetical protein